LINYDAVEPYAEFYFNTIISIENVINAFNEIVQSARSINNSFKTIHDYGKIIEEIDKRNKFDITIFTLPAFLIFDFGLHYIPTIINLILSKTQEIYKKYLYTSIIEMYNSSHLHIHHRIIALYNVEFKYLYFQLLVER
jgi:hypothetical protein